MGRIPPSSRYGGRNDVPKSIPTRPTKGAGFMGSVPQAIVVIPEGCFRHGEKIIIPRTLMPTDEETSAQSKHEGAYHIRWAGAKSYEPTGLFDAMERELLAPEGFCDEMEKLLQGGKVRLILHSQRRASGERGALIDQWNLVHPLFRQAAIGWVNLLGAHRVGEAVELKFDPIKTEAYKATTAKGTKQALIEQVILDAAQGNLRFEPAVGAGSSTGTIQTTRLEHNMRFPPGSYFYIPKIYIGKEEDGVIHSRWWDRGVKEWEPTGYYKIDRDQKSQWYVPIGFCAAIAGLENKGSIELVFHSEIPSSGSMGYNLPSRSRRVALPSFRTVSIGMVQSTSKIGAKERFVLDGEHANLTAEQLTIGAMKGNLHFIRA